MELQAKLDLTRVSRFALEDFLAKVPVEAELFTQIELTQGDRPWESDQTTASLVARWEG